MKMNALSDSKIAWKTDLKALRYPFSSNTKQILKISGYFLIVRFVLIT